MDQHPMPRPNELWFIAHNRALATRRRTDWIEAKRARIEQDYQRIARLPAERRAFYDWNWTWSVALLIAEAESPDLNSWALSDPRLIWDA